MVGKISLLILLVCAETFYVFKCQMQTSVYHNGWYMFDINRRSNWRASWADAVTIPPSQFLKSKKEIRMGPEEKQFEEVETYTPDTAGCSSDEGVSQAAFAEALNECLKADAIRVTKARAKHFRREQLSQGVLLQVLKMFGRVGLDQEPCVVVDPFCGTGNLCTEAFLYTHVLFSSTDRVCACVTLSLCL